MTSVALVGIALTGASTLACLGVGNLSWFAKMTPMEMAVFP